MTSTMVKNEMGYVIGYVEEDNFVRNYRSLTYGIVAYYDKQKNLFIRIKEIPGKPNMSMYGDMGESDLRYWSK